MQITPKAAAVGFALIAALALGGCVQSPPPVVPTAPPSVKPVFASDAAALAAAKKAYLGYAAASDAIGADGGKEPGRITKWVTPRDLPDELKVFMVFAKTGNRLVGPSRITVFRLEQVQQSSERRVSLTAYACVDVSGSRLLSPNGTDITPASRQSILPLEVMFANDAVGSRRMLFDRSEPWSGTDFCS